MSLNWCSECVMSLLSLPSELSPDANKQQRESEKSNACETWSMVAVFKLCVKQFFSLWVCYLYLFYSAASLSHVTISPPAPIFLSGFHVFHKLNNGNESVLKLSLCKSLALLSSPVYSERHLSGIIFHNLGACCMDIHVLSDSG